jgi:PAS domain S-box-containing protein
MEIMYIISGFAVGAQLVAVYFAIRLMRFTEKGVIAIVFVLLASLMTFRRSIEVERVFSQGVIKTDLLAETAALFISLLMVYVIISIARIFKSEEENRNAATSSEKLYRTLFDESPDGVVLVDAQGDILDFNDKINEQLGYTREEFSKLRISDIDPVESPFFIRAGLEKVLKDGRGAFEVKHKTKQGTIRDVLVIMQTLVLSGQPFFLCIWRDITEQKLAEEVLRRKDMQLQAVLKATAEGILASDDKSKIITANRRLAEFWKIHQAAIDADDDNMILNYVLEQLANPEAFLNKVRELRPSFTDETDGTIIQ